MTTETTPKFILENALYAAKRFMEEADIAPPPTIRIPLPKAQYDRFKAAGLCMSNFTRGLTMIPRTKT